MTDASQPLQAELEQQLRLNLELRAALDDCRLAASSPLPLAAWQLPLLQHALGSSPEAPPLPPAADPAGWLARLQLAWVRLGQGQAEAAAALQAELQTQLNAADDSGLAGLDLLNRVLDSQAWLAGNATPPPAEHSAIGSAGLRLALDQLSLTADGRGLCIDGWCIDPAGQLAALVLLRGPQALPLPPATGDANANISDQPVLFVQLHNGEQACLSRPVHPEHLAWSELLALSPPWPAP